MVHARTARQVLEMLQLPPERGGDITRTVMLDPALTTAVVRAANSAHLGYSRRISGVRQATVLLGGTLVASLAAGRAADLVFDPDPPVYPEWLWPHSLAVAAACTVLAKRLEEPVDDAFTVGMVHDIGILLMCSNRMDLDDEEVDHTKLAGTLLTRWNFPDRIVAAVRHHHARADALVDPLQRIVVAAHGLAAALGAPSPEPSVGKLEALRIAGLAGVRTAVILGEVEQELASLTSELRGPA